MWLPSADFLVVTKSLLSGGPDTGLCYYVLHLILTAPDELAGALHGRHCRLCVNEWVNEWVKVRQYCKALWMAIGYRKCAV